MLIQRVGILYHPKVAAAERLAKELSNSLSAHSLSFWLSSSWDEEVVRENLIDSQLLVGMGGDGTIIRAVRSASLLDVPVLGVNFGRLGFMAELSPEDAVSGILAVCTTGGYIEERALLQTRVVRRGEHNETTPAPALSSALNDVVIARGAPSRPLYIEVGIDNERLTTYRADGVIVSTATGSTGYNLSAGGPIIYPTARDMVITPVAPHVALINSIIVPESSIIRLTVSMDHKAVLSIDGQEEIEMEDGDSVEVRVSKKRARFMRVGPEANFFGGLMTRLRWGEEVLP
ncbi:MAG: NAD(+)/NADH kinase [Dehalococcoidia bacterium]|nr:NAD(+)/NADH kinase [Dehalococcoidia bacterium]